MKDGLMADEIDAAENDPINIKVGLLSQRLAAEFQKAGDDLLTTERLANDLGEVFPVKGGVFQLPFQQFRIDQDARQGIVDFRRPREAIFSACRS